MHCRHQIKATVPSPISTISHSLPSRFMLGVLGGILLCGGAVVMYKQCCGGKREPGGETGDRYCSLPVFSFSLSFHPTHTQSTWHLSCSLYCSNLYPLARPASFFFLSASPPFLSPPFCLPLSIPIPRPLKIFFAFFPSNATRTVQIMSSRSVQTVSFL